jgi:hypothetical protein
LAEVFDEVDGPHGQVVGSVRRPAHPPGDNARHASRRA